MGKLILTISKKGERSSSLYKLDAGDTTIGRAYDNDIIIDDPYVSPHQFRLVTDDGDIRLEVVDEINPILVNNKVSDETSFVMKVGEILSVGKTQLQLLSEDTDVAKTKQQFMSKWPMLNRVGPMVAILSLLIYSLLSSLLDFLQNSTDLEWREPAYMALFVVVIVVIWAAIWAVAGRIYKHQSHFFVQLLVTSIVGILFLFITPVVEFIDFQSNKAVVGIIAGYVVVFLFLFVLLKANMVIATNSLRTSLIAFACSIFLVAIALATTQYSSDQFDFDRQNFPGTVKPPFAIFSKPVSIESYLESIGDIKLSDSAEK